MTPPALAPEDRAGPWAAELWHAVVAGDEAIAAGTALAALRAGLDAESVLLDVVAAVQRRVGEEWAADRMTVAQEHAATAINERVLAALSREGGVPGIRPGALPGAARGARGANGACEVAGGRGAPGTSEAPAPAPATPVPPIPAPTPPPAGAPTPPPTTSVTSLPPLSTSTPSPSPRPRITVACVDGEWHALPARLLAEVLILRGWRVDFLGAQVPTAHLVAHLRRTGADAVALSGSLATRLPAAHTAIRACRAAGVPVLAGGAAFGPGGRHAELLGADLWAADARDAAARLAAGPPRPPTGPPLADGGLKHLLDQEYTLISRAAPQLVHATLKGLGARFPALRDYTDVQHQHTAEDLAHVVAFLAAALYVDDCDLFVDFARWTAPVLAARRVPVTSLLHALDVLRAEVRDFPRATAMIHEAHDVVRTSGTGLGRAPGE